MINIELYSNENETIKILEELKNKEKEYNKIINALQVLGNFSNKIEVNLYEIKCTKDEYYIKLWLTDLEDDIFIIYANSLNKKDLSKITKITNNHEITYDLSLLKKYTLTKDNIDIIKTDKVFDFKYGRLITDEKTFFSVFLQNSIIYQINIDSSTSIDSKDLKNKLNKCDKLDLKDFIKIFEIILFENNIDFNTISLACYKNFDRICLVKDKKQNNIKSLKK